MRPVKAVAAAFALALAATVGGGAPAKDLPVPASLRDAGVKRFQFASWPGPDLPVWYYRPARAGTDAPVLFVFHGVKRDADRYLAQWLAIAEKNGVVVVVPEFTQKNFRGAEGYNFGAMMTAEGEARPRGQWSYSLLEPLFDAIVAREGLQTKDYLVFGHSAGAQFVHRMILTGAGPRLKKAVSANAGSYAMPTDQVAWPFGFGGVPDGAWDPARAYRQPMTVLLGTADDDPDYPSLPRQPQAMAQGPHRLERGQKFYRMARADAASRQAPFHWQCAFAPGIGHDNGGMAPFAIAILLDRVRLTPGADCREIAAD